MTPFVTSLLERQQCLDDLARWLFTTAGGGCIALVDGEAGIGKTALVREFTARQTGRRILWGACDDLFTPRALAPLHDIARQAKGTLLEAINSNANRDVIFNAVLDDLERGAPATVVFEDLQWADEATLDLLKFLGRRIDRTRAMLVITYRGDEIGPSHPLRSVIGDLPRAHIRRMTPGLLSEQSVAKLARQAGLPPANIHALTGGNPLLVMEVLGAGTSPVPVAVRDSVLARVLRLSPQAREIAEFVSLFPGNTDVRPLAQEFDESAIESCRSIGVIRNEEGLPAFRHELIRRAVESSLSETRRHTLHTRILEVLMTDSSVAAARLAHHADGCNNAGAVLEYATIAAARAALSGAHREAASHYQTALRYADSLAPEERASLHEKAAYECYLIGERARATQMWRAALEIWRAVGDRSREPDILHWLATIECDDGRRGVPDSSGSTEESLQLALAEGFPDRIARAYINLASAALGQRRYADARRYQEGGLHYCNRHGLAAWRLNMIACSARIKFDQGDWIGCCDDVDAVLRGPCATARTRIAALTVLARVRLRRGDPDPESPLHEAQALADSLQELDGLVALAVTRAEAAWLSDGVINDELATWLFRAGLEIAGQWQTAAEAWKKLGCPYEHATILAMYGREAEKREALAIFEGLGAAPAARAIRRQFRAEGIKRVPRGARPTTQSNQFGLTKREAEVLSLLSRGMRNAAIARALFVSQKTVDHHVSSILGKLGVPSRGAAVVVTRGAAVANSH